MFVESRSTIEFLDDWAGATFFVSSNSFFVMISFPRPPEHFISFMHIFAFMDSYVLSVTAVNIF